MRRTQLYVVALTDVPLEVGRGGRALHSVGLTRGIHAICERRDTSPEPSDAELRAQHALVVALAEAAPAILPVRFGALMPAADLRRTVTEHADEIRAALDEVRGKAQMTIRITGRPRPAASTRAARSGSDYLRLKRATAEPLLPPSARRLLDAVGPVVARERRERGVGRLLATVYHLVLKDELEAYRRAAAGVHARGVVISGPWPPFAFAPRWSA